MPNGERQINNKAQKKDLAPPLDNKKWFKDCNPKGSAARVGVGYQENPRLL